MAASFHSTPAQLVGANFKKKIRPRQISRPFFFLLVDFPPRGGCRIYQTGGGGAASIGPRALETLATPLVVGAECESDTWWGRYTHSVGSTQVYISDASGFGIGHLNRRKQANALAEICALLGQHYMIQTFLP